MRTRPVQYVLPASFTGADARFYRTVVPLNLSVGHDVSFAFELRTTTRDKLRAQLYVNGSQVGEYTVLYIGNQATFPVFPSIRTGTETTRSNLPLGAERDGRAEGVTWEVLGAHRSVFDLSFDGDYLRPGWFDRSEYA